MPLRTAFACLALFATGCTTREAPPDAAVAEMDAGPGPDAFVGAVDSAVARDSMSAMRDASMRDGGPGRDGGPTRSDAGPRDAGHDAGSDAGTDAGADAGPDYDAGPLIGDSCADAIDLEMFTTMRHYEGSTCPADDTVTHACNPDGTPDRLYFVHGATHSFTVTVSPGYVFYLVNPGCGLIPGATCFGSTTAYFFTDMYFAVEKAGGGCGDYSISLTP